MFHLFLTVAAILFPAVLAAPSWEKVPVTNPYVPRSEGSLGLCAGNKLCLLGGRGSDPVSILDTKSLSWTKGKNPPKEIHHFQALQGPDKCAWVVGAWTGPYPAESTVDNILKYCPDNDQWSTGPKINRPRGAGGAVLYNGAVYLISGNVGGHNINAKIVPWFDKYDVKSGEWSQLPDIPHPRDHFHAVVVGKKLYVAGGRDSSGNAPDFFDDVESKVDVFDFEIQKWSTLDDFPRPRGGTFAAVLDSQVFVLGGEGQGRAWAEVDVLDNTVFKAGQDMPGPRHGAGAVSCNGAIWVAGGAAIQGGGKNAVDTVAYYDSDQTPICGAPETTSPADTSAAVESPAATETTAASSPTETPVTSTNPFSSEPSLSFAPVTTPLVGPTYPADLSVGDPLPSDEAVPVSSDEATPVSSGEDNPVNESSPSQQPVSAEEDTASNALGSEDDPSGSSESDPSDPSVEQSGGPSDGTGSEDENGDASPSPSEESSGPACFPSDAIVELDDGTSKTMAELRIGDHVKVASSGEYSPIFFFSHRHFDTVNQFVQIATSIPDLSLTVSAGHLIYVNDRLAPASTVEIGDKISISHKLANTVAVTSTTRISSNGLHNPHTLHGDIVVNGVVASTFTSTVHPSIARLFLFPFKLAYGLVGAHRITEEMNRAILRSLDRFFWRTG